MAKGKSTAAKTAGKAAEKVVGSATKNKIAGKVAGSAAKKAVEKIAEQAEQAVKDPNDIPEVNKEVLKRYTPGLGEQLGLGVGVPLLGDIAKGVGTGVGAYQSMLGAALQAIAAQRSGNPYNRAAGNSAEQLLAAGAGNMALGKTWETVGNLLANRAYTSSDQLRAENQQKRLMRLQLEKPQSGAWYHEQRMLGNNTPYQTEGAAGKGIKGYANGTDDADPGLALVGENGPELVNFNGGEQVYSNEDIEQLLQATGIDLKDDDDDSILDKYADNMVNYLYKYRPEATSIDASIDPNENQIGIMAQDLEQVNPACVTETPEGVKEVDTRKLALMNAGAIGDLARELEDIKQKLQALGV